MEATGDYSGIWERCCEFTVSRIAMAVAGAITSGHTEGNICGVCVLVVDDEK